MAKKHIIKIDKELNVTVETKGYAGGECQRASRFIEEALGTKVKDERTREYYQSASHSAEEREKA